MILTLLDAYLDYKKPTVDLKSYGSTVGFIPGWLRLSSRANAFSAQYYGKRWMHRGQRNQICHGLSTVILLALLSAWR